MTDYTALDNEKLLEEYDRLWRSYMYFMAAEGNWSSETNDRKATEAEFWACEKEVDARGLRDV